MVAVVDGGHGASLCTALLRSEWVFTDFEFGIQISEEAPALRSCCPFFMFLCTVSLNSTAIHVYSYCYMLVEKLNLFTLRSIDSVQHAIWSDLTINE